MSSAHQPCHVLIVVNVEWYFWSHRLALARALKRRGVAVTVATAVERDRRAAIEAEGFRFIELGRLRRRSMSPWRELLTFLELFRLYRRVRPDLVHHVSIKPVLYGSLAAKLAGVRAVVNTVPGLGYMFTGRGAVGRLRRFAATWAYRAALAGNRVRVIVQNPEDLRLFVRERLVDPARAVVILGSGVDTAAFQAAPEPASAAPIVVLASRMLWDKGVGDLVAAGRLLKAKGVACRLVLVGIPDAENPNSIGTEQLRQWESEGTIEWWGLRHDMADILRDCAIVTLPTYYPEGVPKILIEGAAAGRPLVATDAPGCREIIRDGENGFLVPPRDPPQLAAALERLLSDRALRRAMGERSRDLAVREFDEALVIARTLDVYRALAARV